MKLCSLVFLLVAEAGWSFVYIYERPILMGRLNLRLVQILILMEMHAFSVKMRAFSPNLHKMHAFSLKMHAFSPNLHKMCTFSRKCVHFHLICIKCMHFQENVRILCKLDENARIFTKMQEYERPYPVG